MTWEDELQCYASCNQKHLHNEKFQITPYMSELIEATQSMALQKQFFPNSSKYNFQFQDDYLSEDKYMPIQNLIHRYRNKVIIIATDQCACYCQFCTRQRITRKGEINFNNFSCILAYLKEHKEITDVLITGGDPLTLSTNKIIGILQEINKIDNIKIIRIGTRIPITLPQRIDTELIKELQQFTNLYINIHVNHPDELTTHSKKAILSLANAGIPLGSQLLMTI